MRWLPWTGIGQEEEDERARTLAALTEAKERLCDVVEILDRRTKELDD